MSTSLELSAVYRDADGDEVPGKSISWTSLDTAIATVSSQGLARGTGTGTGQVIISATSGSISGYALLTLAPAGALPVGALTFPDTATTAQLNVLWGASPNDVFAAGADGVLLHFDGTGWTPETSGTGAQLSGLWGSGQTVFAVGDGGTILQRDSVGVWSARLSGITQTLSGVWGAAPNDVYAVGAQGTILHFDGNRWSDTSLFSQALHGVWGTSATNVFAVGDQGTIVHYDGTRWTSSASGVGSILLGVWGTSPSDVYAVGNGGTVLHFDGTTWSSASVGTDQTLYGVWGTSSGDVYAAGAHGTLVHFDGSAWSAVATGFAVTARSIWGTLGGDLYVAGDVGTLLDGKRGGPAKLVFASAGSSVLAGAPDTVTVWVVDSRGGRVARNSIPITLSVASGPDSVLLGVATALTNDSGIATFTDVVLRRAGTGYTLLAASPGLGGVESPALAVLPGKAYRTRYVVPPAGAVAGMPFAPSVQVAVEDTFGNFATSSASVQISLGAHPPSAQLFGPAVRPTVAGIATFDSDSLKVAAGGYTLVASVAGGSVTDTSPPFTVVPGPAQSLFLDTDAVILAVNGTGTLAVTLAQDVYYNPVSHPPIWTSLNPAVVTVDNAGHLIAVGNGQAGVSATVDSISASAVVTVSAVGGTAVTHWQQLSTNTSATLRGVSGTTASHVYAVGDGGTILLWNGATWTPDPSGQSADLSAVWVSSATAALVAGVASAATDSGPDFGILLHNPTGGWSPAVTTFQAGNGGSHPGPLYGAWGPTRNALTAVGADVGGGRMVVASSGGLFPVQFDGSSGTLLGVWGLSPRLAYAAGNGVFAGGSIPGWGPVLNAPSGSMVWTGVWGTSFSNVFLAGNIKGIKGNAVSAVIAHYNGASWSLDTVSTQNLRAVGGTGPSDVYAVGDSGTIVHFNGATWTPLISPASVNWNAIWVAPTGEVFIVGAGGTVYEGTP